MLLSTDTSGAAPATVMHLVSDSTGETASRMFRACLAQFDARAVDENLWTFVRSRHMVDAVLQDVEKRGGLVLYTLVDEELGDYLKRGCERLGVPVVSVLSPVLQAMEHILGMPHAVKPGRQHRTNADYYRRIEAMEYAVSHDDGHGQQDLFEADVLLLGVSRTSKTPCCIYLAYRGVKAANIPLVPELGAPEAVEKIAAAGLEKPLIVGLTQDPNVLLDIRKNRLAHLGAGASGYAGMESIREELRAASRLFQRLGCPVIDVTHRSVEETAAMVLNLLHHPARLFN
jgi:[pyruvate, water dikinase]-phosphate phosphotransferase / [pyruvate, water dikinase] kinase